MDETPNKTYKKICDVANVVESLVEKIVTRYVGDMDTFVHKVEKYLNESSEIEDFELQRLVLRFPVLLYKLSDGMTRAALESEIAKIAVEHVKSESVLTLEGTATDRRAHATLRAEDEELTRVLTNHIYEKIKGKRDAAQAMYEGVKKIMTARDTEKQMFRYVKKD